MKVMVADDSNTMRRILCQILQKISITDIVEAKDGLDAQNKLKEEAVEVILLDWNMPKLDGLTFLKNLRADENFKNIKVIMVTSESEKSKVVEAIKAGANDYIAKPFTPEVLKEKLKGVGLIE